jgi:hypothetical protein
VVGLKVNVKQTLGLLLNTPGAWWEEKAPKSTQINFDDEA